jgi:membrane-associated protease RseP (regulator of RpoE activity)
MSLEPGETGEPPPRRGPSGGSNRAALGRLLLAAAVIVAVAAVLHGFDVLVVILALIVMVMLHELGHFAAAKWSGMKVTEYFLGFGPRLWSVRHGETEYGIKAIPAGGYVRIVGMTSAEEVDDADEPRSYRQASFPRRFAVAVAGSVMHFVMAFLLLWSIFAFAGGITTTRPVAGLVRLAGAVNPAEQAGLRTGDVIVAVDGRAVTSGGQLVSTIEGDADKTVTLTVQRGGRTLILSARPVDGRDVRVVGASAPAKSGPSPVGFLGVELDERNETVNPFVALGHGASELASVTATTGKGIATVFSLHGLGAFFHDVATAGQHRQASATASGGTTSGATGSSGSSGSVLSIYGAVVIGAQALRQDIYELLYLLAVINVFVGMVNLFPMLPLDGGHVLIAVYERVRSRRGRRYHADVTKLMPVAYLFLAFIVVVGLSALYANIVAPPSLGG